MELTAMKNNFVAAGQSNLMNLQAMLGLVFGSDKRSKTLADWANALAGLATMPDALGGIDNLNAAVMELTAMKNNFVAAGQSNLMNLQAMLGMVFGSDKSTKTLTDWSNALAQLATMPDAVGGIDNLNAAVMELTAMKNNFLAAAKSNLMNLQAMLGMVFGSDKSSKTLTDWANALKGLATMPDATDGIQHMIDAITQLQGVNGSDFYTVTSDFNSLYEAVKPFLNFKASPIVSIRSNNNDGAFPLATLKDKVDQLATSLSNVKGKTPKLNVSSSNNDSALSLDYLVSKIGNVQTAIGNLKGTTVKIKIEEPNYNSFGEALVAGLNNGISGAIAKYGNPGDKLAAKIKSAIASSLGIHSPSKVAHGMGEFVTQGLANGMLDKIKEVVSATQQMAQAIQDGVDTITPPTLTPVLDMPNNWTAGKYGVAGVPAAMSATAPSFDITINQQPGESADMLVAKIENFLGKRYS
jgi:hypothetical protein